MRTSACGGCVNKLDYVSKYKSTIAIIGVLANENNSHNTIPYAQTSDCIEKFLSPIASRAIHLTGNNLYK